MIKRFQEIKNIGAFKNDKHISQCEFMKVTLLYGGNSHGKSTFCDIIKSLNENKSEYIEERKRINSTEKPKVKINFGDKKEAVYANEKWTISSSVQDVGNILVFDSEFVERNVFTNSTIERKNKENFTDFILGSEGIAIQEKLIDLKNEKTKIDNEINGIKSQIEKEIDISFDDLLKIKYVEDIHNEDNQCASSKQQIVEMQKNKDEINYIKSLKLPQQLQFANVFIDKLCCINNILASQYEFSREDIIEDFKRHKERLSTKNMDFDSWVIKGMQLSKNSICPYCGQQISENQLVESYITLFCETFLDYAKKIDSLVALKIEDFDMLKFKSSLLENETRIEKLAQKIHAEGFEGLLDEYRNANKETLEVYDELEQIVENIVAEYNNKIDTKLKNKYIAVDEVDLSKVKIIFDEFEKSFKSINILIDKMSKIADEYLRSLSVSKLDTMIYELTKQYNKAENVIKRNKYNDLIEEYLIKKIKSKENSASTKKLKTEFEDEQSKFIKEFFEDIDEYYKRLGSKNYQIEKNSSSHGTKKVYSLKLKFQGVEVPTDKIQFVLSDSDKRALALSVFLAKLKHNILSNTIIVMDDPITSFDNERMGLFINIIKELDNVEQIIILTHYKEFYKKFADFTSNMNPCPTFLKIKKCTEGSEIVCINKENDVLLMNDYEQSLYKMWSFLNGITHDYASNDARTLMQKVLEYKFYHEIRNKKINTWKFEAFLKELHENKLIDDNKFKRLNSKREEYNVPSHNFDTDPEDMKRNSIEELKEILYSI